MSTKQRSAIHNEEAGDVTEQRNHKPEVEGEEATEDVVGTQPDRECKSKEPAEEATEVIDTQQNTAPSSENQGQGIEEETNTYHDFDRDQTHFPVFCLTKPTDEYWEEFISHASDVPWIEICYDSPSRDSVIESIERNLDKEGPWPFIGRTIEEVYDFHKKYLRPVDESRSVDPFTYFTFLIIDDECVNSDPPHCMVCCDAPDYEDPDGEITLKSTLVPIETAIWMLVPLEQLAMTPTEALGPDGTALSSIPPFTQAPVSDLPDENFTVATFADARAFKREGIRQREVALRPMAERWMDDGRRTHLFRVPLKEATVVAHLYRQGEVSSRTKGATLRFISNPGKRPRSEDGDDEADEEDEGSDESNGEGTEEKRRRRE